MSYGEAWKQKSFVIRTENAYRGSERIQAAAHYSKVSESPKVYFYALPCPAKDATRPADVDGDGRDCRCGGRGHDPGTTMF